MACMKSALVFFYRRRLSRCNATKGLQPSGRALFMECMIARIGPALAWFPSSIHCKPLSSVCHNQSTQNTYECVHTTSYCRGRQGWKGYFSKHQQCPSFSDVCTLPINAVNVAVDNQTTPVFMYKTPETLAFQLFNFHKKFERV